MLYLPAKSFKKINRAILKKCISNAQTDKVTNVLSRFARNTTVIVSKSSHKPSNDDKLL